jgi:hypothetical protein
MRPRALSESINVKNELRLKITIALAVTERSGKCIVHFSGDVFFRDEKEEPPRMG